MFYNRGEVISDQFDHLKVIGFRVSVRPQRWIVTIPSLDQWLQTIENHHHSIGTNGCHTIKNHCHSIGSNGCFPNHSFNGNGPILQKPLKNHWLLWQKPLTNIPSCSKFGHRCGLIGVHCWCRLIFPKWFRPKPGFSNNFSPPTIHLLPHSTLNSHLWPWHSEETVLIIIYNVPGSVQQFVMNWLDRRS